MSLNAGIPIPSRAAPPRRGPPGARTGLLVVGHGSQCHRSEAEMQAIADEVAATLTDVAIEVGFLEMTEPAAGAAFDALVSRGCQRVVVLPLVLLGAGHAKSDVPAVVIEGRQRHPEVDVRYGTPLGVERELVAILGGAVLDAGGGGAPLLLIARGTSDPDANGDAYKAARLVGEWTGAPFVHVGFSGVTGPRVPDAADVFARLGYPRLAVAFWFLCHGKLVERARADLAAFAGHSRVDVVDAGHFGPDVRLAPLVVARYRQAMAGARAENCDTCAYRAPWPGLEDRVGQAVGVGHSHRAVEHRHRHR